jgi:hypothetical protein
MIPCSVWVQGEESINVGHEMKGKETPWHVFKMFLSGLVLAAAIAGPQQAMAEPVQVRTDYKVSLVGFPVASAKFITQVDGASYSITGDLRSSAFSDLFSKVRGNANVSGKVTADKLEASSFW